MFTLPLNEQFDDLPQILVARDSVISAIQSAACLGVVSMQLQIVQYQLEPHIVL